METKSFPAWLSVIDEEETLFLKQFLLTSGSLKQLATLYGVSYPTIRARLDRIIDKVQVTDSPSAGDSFEKLLDVLVEQGVVVPGTARTLMQGHRRVLRDVSERVERNLAPEFAADAWHE
ncbi:MAG: DUF2089 family protein [Candidatus Hydrogenedentes bacterium]|nr:DUF2089 family protein [Candidatus Hydrogenedentota bacterium]